MHDFPNLTILDHPLIRHKLTVLRERDTSMKLFRELVEEISMLMAYEVTKDLPLEKCEIDTPLERTEQYRLAGKKLTIVPILRAGLGMVEGVARLIPSARVGHIGLYREHDTLQPVDYYFKIPGGAELRDFILLDPMLATGGSLLYTCEQIVEHNCGRLIVACVLAAPEGLEHVAAAGFEVEVHTASVDDRLNEVGFIVPGLGDAGDRQFGAQ